LLRSSQPGTWAITDIGYAAEPDFGSGFTGSFADGLSKRFYSAVTRVECNENIPSGVWHQQLPGMKNSSHVCRMPGSSGKLRKEARDKCLQLTRRPVPQLWYAPINRSVTAKASVFVMCRESRSPYLWDRRNYGVCGGSDRDRL
jgi:hypothetical protein